MSNHEAEMQNAKQLVGGVITGVCETDDKESFGLTVDMPGSQRKRYLAWVDRDPEGNGPGHLNIASNR